MHRYGCTNVQQKRSILQRKFVSIQKLFTAEYAKDAEEGKALWIKNNFCYVAFRDLHMSPCESSHDLPVLAFTLAVFLCQRYRPSRKKPTTNTHE